MLRWALARLYERLDARYPRLILAAQFQLAHLVVLGGVALLSVYVHMGPGQLLRIVVVSQVLVAIDNALALGLTSRLLRHADPWLRGERTPETAAAAWRAMAGLALDFVRYRKGLPVLMNIVPIAIYINVELQGGLASFFVLLAGSALVLTYGVFLRFFAMEIILRPVLERVSADLPDGPRMRRETVPLRWRLLIALPAINVITGVTVSGLSTHGQASLADLGFDVLVAIGVAFTLSLELSVLLSRSVLEPIDDLREGTERVAAGDYSVRVPVVGTDELGRLAGSFNQMVSGLEEREKLREAFGAFVDPRLAERVLEEGTRLAGEEMVVSVLFLDIRGFTAFAERASAREVVDELNAFYERVVPVLRRHGGHANKFVGDGLLGVFGAPGRLPDHADRCVAAALEIAAVVAEAYRGELRIGIGVNSGTVLAGTIGGGGHVEFTVIGDAVNTAARVERVTRQTGDDVLVTEATRSLLERETCAFAERGTVALRGKVERVRLFAPEVRVEAAAASEAVPAPGPGSEDELPTGSAGRAGVIESS